MQNMLLALPFEPLKYKQLFTSLEIAKEYCLCRLSWFCFKEPVFLTKDEEFIGLSIRLANFSARTNEITSKNGLEFGSILSQSQKPVEYFRMIDQDYWCQCFYLRSSKNLLKMSFAFQSSSFHKPSLSMKNLVVLSQQFRFLLHCLIELYLEHQRLVQFVVVAFDLGIISLFEISIIDNQVLVQEFEIKMVITPIVDLITNLTIVIL